MCEKIRLVKIVMTWEESMVSLLLDHCHLSCLGFGVLVTAMAFSSNLDGTYCCVGSFWSTHECGGSVFTRAASNHDNAVAKALVKFRETSNEAGLQCKEAVKLKDVKDVWFGSYNTEIPAFNLTRHYDRPLPESFARLYPPKGSPEIANKQALWLPSQQLFGSMIPWAKIVYMSVTVGSTWARLIDWLGWKGEFLSRGGRGLRRRLN